MSNIDTAAILSSLSNSKDHAGLLLAKQFGSEQQFYKFIIEHLSNSNITKKEYDSIISILGDKAGEVWRYICKQSNRKLQWWGFSNDVTLGRGHGSTGGFFNPETDSEFIEIVGDTSLFVTDYGQGYEVYDNPHYKYHEGFPTELLWKDDWKEIVDQHIKDAVDTAIEERNKKLEKKKEKKARIKQAELLKKEMIVSIKDKVQPVLTTEEYNLLLEKLR